MAAVLQLEPRFIDPFDPAYPAGPGAPARSLRLLEPDSRELDRQSRPRPARSHQRAVYRRRRVLAALVGLGLLLTVARAGASLGGAFLATPERLPHVQYVVVQSGDSLWSIAQRAVPGHDVRPIVDRMAAELRGATLAPGMSIAVPTP